MNSYKDKATLEELHTRRGMTLAAIGAMFGVSNVTISRHMKRLGVAVLTSSGDAFTGRQHSQETKARMAEKRRRMAGGWSMGRENLEDLYVNQGLSTNKIASIVGCNTQTVVNWLERYGIPKRARGACIKGQHNPMYGKPRSERSKGAWYVNADGVKLWFRSSYEVRVARVLDAKGIEWLYESRRFTLKDRTYCPDFYLIPTGEIWEVKGWFTEYDQETVKQFRELYPHITFTMIFKKDIEWLEAGII